MGNGEAKLTSLGKVKKAKHRSVLQDWSIWLSESESSRRDDVKFDIENIRKEELKSKDQLLFERIQAKFKSPLVAPENFYLQYKLGSELYPINVELSRREQHDAAFRKFAALKLEEYIKFGPTLVLHCRAPSWTAPVEKVGVEIVELRGRPALTRYLAKTYMDGELSLEVLDEIMTLPTGALSRAVHGTMPFPKRDLHGYLLEKKRVKEPDAQDLYKCGAITFKEYEETLFPEIKLTRERRFVHHPVPEEPGRCIVCHDISGTVSCMVCPNKVCRTCVARECLDKDESFLYFHSHHCLRFGRPFRKPLAEMEDVYRRGEESEVFLPGRGAAT